MDEFLRVAEVEADVTRALRQAVLRANSPGYSTAPGDTPGARHLAALDGETVVGSAVLIAEPCSLWPERPAYRLRGMATAPDRQGQGIGTLVLAAAVALAAETGLIWCNARSTARTFYERHAFVPVGEEYTTADTGVPHFLMYRNLSDTPPRPTV